MKILRTISLLPMLLIAQDALDTKSWAGQVVWWGKDAFWKESYSEHTNGVIESDGEILSNIVAIAARHSQALLLKNDGTVLSCGLNLYGGNDVPAGLSNVASVAVEGSSCWAIRHDGTVVRWGNDEDDDNIVAGLTNTTAITWAGYRSYFALKSDGTVLGMRFDISSNSSIDPTTGLPVPSAARKPVQLVSVAGQVLRNVVAMASMGDSALVLKKDGAVVRLKLSLTDPASGLPLPPFQYLSADPVTVAGQALTNVAALAGGGGHCLALKSDGRVVA